MAKVNCQNEFCAFWKKYKCTCDEACLNIMGNCKIGVNITFPEKILDQKRKQVLKMAGLDE